MFSFYLFVIVAVVVVLFTHCFHFYECNKMEEKKAETK